MEENSEGRAVVCEWVVWCDGVDVPIGHCVGVVGIHTSLRSLAILGQRGRIFDPRDGAALFITTTTTTTTTRRL